MAAPIPEQAERWDVWAFDLMSYETVAGKKIFNSPIGVLPTDGFTFEQRISDAGEFSADIVLPKVAPTAPGGIIDVIGMTNPGKVALFVWRDNYTDDGGHFVWGGIVYSRQWDEASKKLTVTAKEFTSYFDYRVMAYKDWTSAEYPGTTVYGQPQTFVTGLDAGPVPLSSITTNLNVSSTAGFPSSGTTQVQCSDGVHTMTWTTIGSATSFGDSMNPVSFSGDPAAEIYDGAQVGGYLAPVTLAAIESGTYSYRLEVAAVAGFGASGTIPIQASDGVHNMTYTGLSTTPIVAFTGVTFDGDTSATVVDGDVVGGIPSDTLLCDIWQWMLEMYGDGTGPPINLPDPFPSAGMLVVPTYTGDQLNQASTAMSDLCAQSTPDLSAGLEVRCDVSRYSGDGVLAAEVNIEIAAPRIGTTWGTGTNGKTVDLDNAVNWQWPEDGTQIANKTWEQGGSLANATGTGTQLIESAASWVNGNPTPLMEQVVNRSNITNPRQLQAMAYGDLFVLQTPTVTPTVTLRTTIPPALNTYAVGDDMRIRMSPSTADRPNARFPDGLDVIMRPVLAKTTVPPEGPAITELTLNYPPPS